MEAVQNICSRDERVFCICKLKRTETTTTTKKAVSRSEKRCPKKFNDKKTTKMLDKLMFEKTTGLGFVTRTLAHMTEDADLFVTKKFYICYN